MKFDAKPDEGSSGSSAESISEINRKESQELAVLIEEGLESFNRNLEEGNNPQSELSAYKTLCGLRSEIYKLHKLKKAEAVSTLSNIVLHSALRAIQIGCNILEEQLKKGAVTRKSELEVRPSELIFHDLQNSMESVLGADIKPDESILVLQAKTREIFGEIGNAKMFYNLANPEKYKEKVVELETQEPVKSDPFSAELELECYEMVSESLQSMKDKPIMQVEVIGEIQKLIGLLKSN